MSFLGFTPGTIDFFINIRLNNSKERYMQLNDTYKEHVKAPLIMLYEALVPVVLGIDGHICVKRARCVSGAYNDARFSKAEPIKGYMYLHFCADTARESDIPGFFFDASHDGYRCGLQIYHSSSQGMNNIRKAVLFDESRFRALVSRIEASDIFMLEGQDYKKDRFPMVDEPVKRWLNKKSWWIGSTYPQDEAFFSHALADRLSSCYNALADMYLFIKNGLNDTSPEERV